FPSINFKYFPKIIFDVGKDCCALSTLNLYLVVTHLLSIYNNKVFQEGIPADTEIPAPHTRVKRLLFKADLSSLIYLFSFSNFISCSDATDEFFLSVSIFFKSDIIS